MLKLLWSELTILTFQKRRSSALVYNNNANNYTNK